MPVISKPTVGGLCTQSLLAPVRPARRCVSVNARFGGGNVLDRPDVEIKQSGWNNDSDIVLDSPTPDTERGRGGTDRQRGAPPGGGNYRVLLLNSPQHTEKLVVKAITSVVPNADEAHARNCYATSLSLGMALVVSVLKEHAEFYSQQLYRLGCKTAIEPDNTTA